LILTYRSNGSERESLIVTARALRGRPNNSLKQKLKYDIDQNSFQAGDVLGDEEEIKKVLIENYFAALKIDSLDKHCAGFAKDLRTYLGNSENVRDDGLEAYRKRLESKPPWIELHKPAHAVNEGDIGITLDKSGFYPNLASATVWLKESPFWFDVFSLRKEAGSWKIFRVRWIPEGGAPP